MTTECRWPVFKRSGSVDQSATCFEGFQNVFLFGKLLGRPANSALRLQAAVLRIANDGPFLPLRGAELQQSVVAVLTPSTHGSSLGCLLPASWPPAATCLLLAVRVTA